MSQSHETMLLRLEISRLYAVLKPFADAADDLDEKARDASHLWESAAAMNLTAGDLRSAKRILIGVSDPDIHKTYSASELLHLADNIKLRGVRAIEENAKDLPLIVRLLRQEASALCRSCTCHPSEAPVSCQHRYAFSECKAAESAQPTTAISSKDGTGGAR